MRVSAWRRRVGWNRILQFGDRQLAVNHDIKNGLNNAEPIGLALTELLPSSSPAQAG